MYLIVDKKINQLHKNQFITIFWNQYEKIKEFLLITIKDADLS